MKTLAIGMMQSIIRGLFWVGATWLVQHSLWTQGDAEKYVEAGSLVAASLAWSYYEKHGSKVRYLVALQWAAATDHDVKTHIASGAATPPVSTPKDAIPAPISSLPVSDRLM